MTTPPSSRADDPKSYPPEPDEATWNAILEKIAAAVLPPVVPPAPQPASSRMRRLPVAAMLATAAAILVGVGVAIHERRSDTGLVALKVSETAKPTLALVLPNVMPVADSDDVNVWSVQSVASEAIVVGDTPMPEKLVFAGAEEVRVVSGKEYLSLDEPNDRPMIFPFPR